MSINKDQARMLTALALACRPVGAPRWDDAGLFAAIGKVKNWPLPMAIEHVIRHAADPKAKTPGVIGSAYEPPELGKPVASNLRRDQQCIRCGGPTGTCACTREHLADNEPAVSPDLPPPAPSLAARLARITNKETPA